MPFCLVARTSSCLFHFPRSNVRRVLVYTAVFFFLAHGFRFLAPNFSDDSLLISQTENTDWQISLGRFMQPIYWRIPRRYPRSIGHRVSVVFLSGLRHMRRLFAARPYPPFFSADALYGIDRQRHLRHRQFFLYFVDGRLYAVLPVLCALRLCHREISFWFFWAGRRFCLRGLGCIKVILKPPSSCFCLF